MAGSSSSRSKPKASEVAAETRRTYIPLIKNNYDYRTCSVLYPQPLEQLDLSSIPPPFGKAPTFYVREGDPVVVALDWSAQLGQAGDPTPVPFICSANDKRPGGDWETGVVGYEERLCRRSTLSATLATPAPGSYRDTNYPIPIEGGILSEEVVVFRGPHDRYEKLAPEDWGVLPVCSMPPVRWPKLTQMGTKYSFAEERDMVKNKLRAALRICAHKGYTNVVVGDFGLGNGYRNPPQEMAELWREILLWDTHLRGRFNAVVFVFEDPAQSTARLIVEDMNKKSSRHGSSSSGSSRGSKKSSSSSSSSASSSRSSSSSSSPSFDTAALVAPTDVEIFSYIFSEEEVTRVLTQPDPRYGLGTLMT